MAAGEWMQRFLEKFRELLRVKAADGDLSADDLDQAMRQARAHVGGMASGERKRADREEGSRMNEWRLLGQIALSEDGTSGQVQIFPAVGTYNHPRYGALQITPEFLRRVKANFDAKVYQQELPLTIDLEHQSSLSGAAGWIASVDIKGETGMWATVDFNERGKSLVAADSYRYFSPEFYDAWQDPATNKEYSDVLIGGALTNRPFFKGMMPVAMMSEGVLAFVEASTPMDKMPDGENGGDERMMAEKTEGGQNYPASAFLYAPEPDKPSTWKLRIWESPSAKVTKAQLGRAAAALGQGFRGNKVELPAGEKEKCIARLKAEYAKLGVKEDDMPNMMRADLTEIGLSEADASIVLGELGLASEDRGEPMGMSEEEARQFAETRDALKSLSERLAAETEARKAAEASAKTAAERVAAIERTDRRRQLSEFVRDHRHAFEGEVETCVDRLERLATKLSVEEFDEYCAERKSLAGRIKASEAFVQISRPGPGNGTAASEFDAAKRKLMSEKGLDESAAVAAVASSDPALYNRFDREFKRQIKRGDD